MSYNIGIKRVLLVVCYGATFGFIFCSFGINYGDIYSKMSNTLYSTSSNTKSEYWMPECKCSKHANTAPPNRRAHISGGHESICGKEATYLGPDQNVVSFSLFTKSDTDVKQFAHGLEPNLRQVQKLYPGWYLRLYTNINVNTTAHPFCDLACGNDELVWCNVKEMNQLGNISKMNPRMWRFLPFGDPSVKTFISRDLDSDISTRERDAVSEWENSKWIFHMMRDVKKGHDTPMLAGMFGVKNYRLNPLESANLQKQVVKLGLKNPSWKGQDQKALREIIYKTAFVKEMLTHDSYTCEKYPGTVPFPTQRIGHVHVGDSLRKKGTSFVRKLIPCPLACRPKYGQDWTYC